ncbi:tRNA (cytidine(34)-2'-O)-methyltransferase [Spirobacillus cienkowskii]|uniref:tRNA (cytidine(34)-2'-O)-methyltransferase n=1 Tax=Spirobacillus cienkowskii TaxID=495820 RepID=UPI0030D5AC53
MNTMEQNKKKVYRDGLDLLSQHDEVLFQAPQFNYEKSGYLEPLSRDALLKFHPEVALYCPQIPPNTGTIARMCAAFSCRLHLIEPMGFSITEKALRRAGLDYWDHVDVYIHENWDAFLKTRSQRRLIFIETGGEKSPINFSFLPGDVLVFGAETFGIPNELIEKEISNQKAHKLTIPMYNRGVRSLNLSNTVSIAMYVALEKLHSQFKN